MPPKNCTKSGKAKAAAASDPKQATLSFGVRLVLPNLVSEALSKKQKVDVDNEPLAAAAAENLSIKHTVSNYVSGVIDSGIQRFLLPQGAKQSVAEVLRAVKVKRTHYTAIQKSNILDIVAALEDDARADCCTSRADTIKRLRLVRGYESVNQSM